MYWNGTTRRSWQQGKQAHFYLFFLWSANLLSMLICCLLHYECICFPEWGDGHGWRWMGQVRLQLSVPRRAVDWTELMFLPFGCRAFQNHSCFMPFGNSSNEYWCPSKETTLIKSLCLGCDLENPPTGWMTATLIKLLNGHRGIIWTALALIKGKNELWWV